MTVTSGNLIDSAYQLEAVPLHASHAYHEAQLELRTQVDTRLAGRKDIMQLIGNNPLQMMYSNHKRHAAFMSSLFSIQDYGLLARSLPWVYRRYKYHGFSFEYFPVQLRAWKKAVIETLPAAYHKNILAIYDWMLANHNDVIILCLQPQPAPAPITDEWLKIKDVFMESLLLGDHRTCLALSRDYLHATGSILHLYQHIIQQAMYEIGKLWERTEISVAQEHLASAVITKVLLIISSSQSYDPPFQGKVVITTSHNEYHQIGAWMVSDLLEQDGWDTRYLGASTPGKDLMLILDDFLPQLLVISTTIPLNLESTRLLITEIRQNPIHAGLTIVVGGRVFIENPDLYKLIGADFFAANLEEVLRITRALEHKHGIST